MGLLKNREYPRIGLAMAACLAASACISNKIEGQKFRTNLDSKPTGAELFVVPRTDWLELGGAPGSVPAKSSLAPYRVKDNAGVAPVKGYLVLNYEHVLVGLSGSASGTLEFKPTQHHQDFVVTIAAE